MKLPDYIALLNTLLIKDFFNEELPKPFNEHFKKINDQHQHVTHSSTHNSIFVPKVHTEMYAQNSIKYQSTKLWNNLNQILQINLLQQTSGNSKKLISEHLLKITESYTNEDMLHHKIIQFAQTYDTFKNRISNY